MTKPGWQWIRVDVLLTEHPKYVALSSAQRCALLELWLYCGRHLTDGYVRADLWRTFGRADTLAKLLELGWFQAVPGGYQAHDWTEHQRTRADIQAAAEQRRAAALARWSQDANRNPARTTARTPDIMRPAMRPAQTTDAARYADKNREDKTPPPPAAARQIHHLSDPVLDMIITTIRQRHGRTITMKDARAISTAIHRDAPAGLHDTLTFTRTALLTTPLSDYYPNDQPAQTELPTGDPWTPHNSPPQSANGQPPSKA